MAFSSTIDTRPTVIGNLIMVTGTWDASGVVTGSIDLTSLLADIVASGVMQTAGSGASGSGVDGAFAQNTGAAALSVTCVSGQSGLWWAMGHRN